MKKSFVFIFILCIILFNLSFGQDKTKPATGNTSTEPIYIATAACFTGQASVFGTQIRYGVELAQDEINSKGGIKGRRIEIIYQDDAANPQEANLVANKIVSNPEILAIVGHFNSSCSLAAKPIYRDAKIVSISPGSTNTEVCKGSPYFFRNIFTDKFQGESVATYAYKILQLKKAAVLFDNDDYGKGLKDNFCEKAKQLGLEVINPIAFDRESTDFRPLLANIMEQTPEIIFISGLYNQGALIVKQARELGITTPFISGEGLFNPGFLKLAGPASEGTLVTTPFIFDLTKPEQKKFWDKTLEKFKNPPDCWTVLSYDALMIIAKAIEERGADRDAIRQYLASVNSPEKAYKGFSGSLYFDENGDCKKPIAVSVVKNGQYAIADKQLPLE